MGYELIHRCQSLEVAVTPSLTSPRVCPKPAGRSSRFMESNPTNRPNSVFPHSILLGSPKAIEKRTKTSGSALGLVGKPARCLR
jgi:hypothetical protein